MAEEKKAPRAGIKLPGFLKNKWFVLPAYFIAVVILSTVVWMRILNPLYPWQRAANPQPAAPTVDTTTPKAPDPAKQASTADDQGKKNPAAAAQTTTTPAPKPAANAPVSSTSTQAPSPKPATAPAATQTTTSAPPEEVLPVAIVYENPEPSDTEMIWPVSPINIIVRFGRQYSKTMEDWRLHQGVDIKVNENTLVRAALNGKVVSTYTDAQLGEVIVLEHVGGIKTKYGNLVSSGLEIGKTVQRGETIGKIGNTARYEIADGAHLHFEVIKDDNAVDPLEILKLN